MKKTIIRPIYKYNYTSKEKSLRLRSNDIFFTSIDIISFYAGRNRLRGFRKLSSRPLKARKEKYRSLMFRSKWKDFDF